MLLPSLLKMESQRNEQQQPVLSKVSSTADMLRTSGSQVCTEVSAIEIRNAQDLELVIEDQAIPWQTIYSRRNGNIRVKTTNKPDKIIQTSVKIYGASALETAKIYFEQKSRWDKSVNKPSTQYA